MGETKAILVTGANGQVGQEILRYAWPVGVTVLAPNRDALDLTSARSVTDCFAANPVAAVINCAAYTAVDRAETDVATAFAANAMGPALLAQETRTRNVPLIQVSTDYVFDGEFQGEYGETDRVSPLGVYGASKLAGELAVRTGNPRSVVLRTAWVLSPHRANFLKTMLRLAADREEVGVVGDQFGCPTSAADIAHALATITLRMLDDEHSPVGTYHFVNSGYASWADLAARIFELSRELGGPWATVRSIPTDQYPTPARRPKNSRLSTAKLQADYEISPRPWERAVGDIVIELNKGLQVA